MVFYDTPPPPITSPGNPWPTELPMYPIAKVHWTVQTSERILNKIVQQLCWRFTGTCLWWISPWQSRISAHCEGPLQSAVTAAWFESRSETFPSKQPSCCVYVRLCISTLSCLIPQPCATAVSGSRVRLTSSSFVLAQESLWSHCSSKKKSRLFWSITWRCALLCQSHQRHQMHSRPPPSQQTVSG